MNIFKKNYDLLFLHTHIKIQFTTFKETGYNFFILKYLLFQAPVAQLDRATDF